MVDRVWDGGCGIGIDFPFLEDRGWWIGMKWGSGRIGDRGSGCLHLLKNCFPVKVKRIKKKKQPFFSVPEINCFVRISLPVTVNGNEDFSLMEAKKSFSFRSTRNSS